MPNLFGSLCVKKSLFNFPAKSRLPPKNNFVTLPPSWRREDSNCCRRRSNDNCYSKQRSVWRFPSKKYSNPADENFVFSHEYFFLSRFFVVINLLHILGWWSYSSCRNITFSFANGCLNFHTIANILALIIVLSLCANTISWYWVLRWDN